MSPATRFTARPIYDRRTITAMLNAFEQTKPADRHGQRKIWNRKNTRQLLIRAGLVPLQRRPGCKLFYTFAQLQELDARLVAGLVTGTPEDLDEAA